MKIQEVIEIAINNERAKNALNLILEKFENGSMPEAIALATFPCPNLPSRKWSLLNRIIMMAYGTHDARGFRQWNHAGRTVRKGSKAFYIFGPRLVDDKKQEPDEKGNHPKKLVGFRSIPVFRVEDTEGKKLDYETPKLPGLPLADVAERWGIEVRATFGNPAWYGAYSPSKDVITLASPEEVVFFHELAHAAHKRVNGHLQGEEWEKEIVAELTAASLCYLYGRKPEGTLKQSYQYIQAYAGKAGKDALAACASIIGDVEKVLNLIVTEQGKEAS